MYGQSDAQEETARCDGFIESGYPEDEIQQRLMLMLRGGD